MKTFTVYLLTLTEAGFKEETIHGCRDGALGCVELPGGQFRERRLFGIVRNHLHQRYQYYSLDPDFAIGKRAITEHMENDIAIMQNLLENTKKLLNP